MMGAPTWRKCSDRREEDGFAVTTSKEGRGMELDIAAVKECKSKLCIPLSRTNPDLYLQPIYGMRAC